MTTNGLKIAIDRGGTFCDVWAYVPPNLQHTEMYTSKYRGAADIRPSTPNDNGVEITFKLLSVDPGAYDDAPSEGIRRLLQIVHNKALAKDEFLDTESIEFVRMGTTVATNALLERKGAQFGFLVTKGFKDLLEIGDQTRPDLFDLTISGKAGVLYDTRNVIEVDERVTMEGWSLNTEGASPAELIELASIAEGPGQVVLGHSGEAVRVLRPLDTVHIEKQLQTLFDKGLRSVAVCLIHSYTFPDHEQLIGDIAARIGFDQVSLSSALSPSIKAVSRGNSAALDAYLSPILHNYVQQFNGHFAGGKSSSRTDFMKSDGGLVAAQKFSGLRAVLSGPAGGFVGCALTSFSEARSRPVIGFDMGGTSTDVCRFSGDFELSFENVIANIKVACPQLLIETVAAGGGSRLMYKNGMFIVGPESVGAHPGPTCYRKGGGLSVTDANLVLGRLVPSSFPKIFGPCADEPIDQEASIAAFSQLTAAINSQRPDHSPYTLYEVAAGFIKIANEGMSRPMRKLTEQKGHSIDSHDLCCFGGAGGQHACAIAQGLGIATVIVPKYSSILSAYGIACATLTDEAASPLTGEIIDDFASSNLYKHIQDTIDSLSQEVQEKLLIQGLSAERIEYAVKVGVQYDGADSVFQLPFGSDLKENFIDTHLRETSFSMKRKVRLAGIRVVGSGQSLGPKIEDFGPELEDVMRHPGAPVMSTIIQRAYFEVSNRVVGIETPVYSLDSLPTRTKITGPAIIADSTQTIVVEPLVIAFILSSHVILQLPKSEHRLDINNDSHKTDPVTLGVFANRFMSIAEQMGHTLQRTSVSVSIKERLDFSCSIHGTDGALVANAPHIPIHLGSMQFAVTAQHEHWLGKLRPGDVLLTNHPKWGGTHLPDLTVVTPIFGPDNDTKVLFYVASRGHHTDIGGSAVTSMNPISKELWEEGLHVTTFKLVSQGYFDQERVVELFNEAGKYPGTSATRRIDHNITDLQAAVSANQRGSHLVQQLFSEHGTEKVLLYMKEIQLVARETIQNFFREKYDQFGGRELRATDWMDDGTEIVLAVRIDRASGTAVFDWTGTGPQIHGNFNMPPSLTHAAIIYSLRSMIDPKIPIPLNQGVMDPVTIISPEGTYINPSGIVAIAGSTIGTHRLIDNILRAFEASACFQGCASATGFGLGGKDAHGNVTPGFTYGESMGGGTGAGPTWHGKHATHVHCTNTRLTDVEVLEHRTPMLLRELKIRRGSGGKGRFNGGDGMERTFEARQDVNCSIVSQRRVFPPLGMKGGGNGAKGANTWRRRNDDGGFDDINVGNNGLCRLRKGDIFNVKTPGGGAWGTPDGKQAE